MTGFSLNSNFHFAVSQIVYPSPIILMSLAEEAVQSSLQSCPGIMPSHT